MNALKRLHVKQAFFYSLLAIKKDCKGAAIIYLTLMAFHKRNAHQ